MSIIPPEISWRKYEWIVTPLLAFLISRLAVVGAVIISDLMLTADPGHWDPAPGNHFLGLWARWDSQWYDWIVNEGYWLRPGQRRQRGFLSHVSLAHPHNYASRRQQCCTGRCSDQ